MIHSNFPEYYRTV